MKIFSFTVIKMYESYVCGIYMMNINNHMSTLANCHTETSLQSSLWRTKGEAGLSYTKTVVTDQHRESNHPHSTCMAHFSPSPIKNTTEIAAGLSHNQIYETCSNVDTKKGKRERERGRERERDRHRQSQREKDRDMKVSSHNRL